MPSRFLGIALASLVAIAAYAIFALQLTPQSVLDWNLRLPQVDLGYSVYQASAFDSGGQFYNFSNIRYAAPPTGERRFEPPHLPLTDRTKIQDGQFGNHCPQGVPLWARTILGLKNDSLGGMEDCLFLDVNVPRKVFETRKIGPKVPVLVWIYGGGYTAGSKWHFGSGAGLLAAAEEPMIYVALNYRLGMFGFSAGPSFISEGGTANLGLLDQRAALHWLQRHIAEFGGDPARITLMGESAGGGSVLHQVTAYGGQQGSPFSQAIIQSPGFYPITSHDVMDRNYGLVLDAVGCAPEGAGSSGLECLKLQSEAQLKQANLKAIDSAPYGQFLFGPTVDGIFTPLLPGTLLATEAYDQHVKLMIGQCYNEGGDAVERTTIDAAYFERYLDSFMPIAKKDIREHITKNLYPPPSPSILGAELSFGIGYPTYSINSPYYSTWSSLLDRFISDAVYICLTNYLAKAFRSQTYAYVFSVPPGTHGIDVPYTFYNGPDPRVFNDSLAKTFQKYLTNFVIHGNPNKPGLPYMPLYGEENLVTNINITSIEPMKDPASKEECSWWQKGLYT